MKFLRPFAEQDSDHDNAAGWLLAPAERAGCGVRIERGDATQPPMSTRPDEERYALVLEGSPVLIASAGEQRAKPGDLIFIPAGTTAAIGGDTTDAWVAIEASVGTSDAAGATPRIIELDQSKFEGEGFAYQSLVDRSLGARSMRMNALKVEPGSGSPDYHIHSFAQIYLIQQGEMTIDIGYDRFTAPAGSLVFLPAGVVHRNFNASDGIERHVSLLVPEPREGEIFDYAVTIHEREAELLTAVPESRPVRAV